MGDITSDLTLTQTTQKTLETEKKWISPRTERFPYSFSFFFFSFSFGPKEISRINMGNYNKDPSQINKCGIKKAKQKQ